MHRGKIMMKTQGDNNLVPGVVQLQAKERQLLAENTKS